MERQLDVDERTKLRQLVRRELPRLYALARRLGGEDPEELVQETMVRACRAFPTLRDTKAGPKWLTTILTNVWRDRLRQRGRRPDEVPVDHDEGAGDGFSLYQHLVDEDPWPYVDTMHVDFLGAFSEQDIHEVLQRVPSRYRAPLVLRYVEGYDVAEVADILDRPPGTVMSQLARGRTRFERLLWEYAVESGLVASEPIALRAGRPTS
jgi:RNA polymerase sigma-70 factor, ECF subfamily